jgi:hypothetical protein
MPTPQHRHEPSPAASSMRPPTPATTAIRAGSRDHCRRPHQDAGSRPFHPPSRAPTRGPPDPTRVVPDLGARASSAAGTPARGIPGGLTSASAPGCQMKGKKGPTPPSPQTHGLPEYHSGGGEVGRTGRRVRQRLGLGTAPSPSRGATRTAGFRSRHCSHIGISYFIQLLLVIFTLTNI